MLQTVINNKALFCLTMASQRSTNPQPSEASLTKDVTKHFLPHHRHFMFWLTHGRLVSKHLYLLQCVHHQDTFQAVAERISFKKLLANKFGE